MAGPGSTCPACGGKAAKQASIGFTPAPAQAVLNSVAHGQEDAKRLPSAIFSCTVPSVANATRSPAPVATGVDSLGSRSHLSLAGDVQAAAQATTASEATSG